MYDSFTFVSGAVGGSLIGLSTATLLLLNGDILGASGIMSSVLTNPLKAIHDPTFLWKFALMTTFLLTSIGMASFVSDPVLSDNPNIPIPSPIAYSIAGLFVGFGTRLGNGCTSGHGICGLGRRSPRSLMAVMTFMITGATTAVLTSPTAPWADQTAILRTSTVTSMNPNLGYITTAIMFLGIVLVLRTSKPSPKKEDFNKVLGASIAGIMFAAGLGISGMILPSKLYTFLDVTGLQDGSWDPTLMAVMGAGIPVSFIAYQFVPNFGILFGSNKQLQHPFKTDAFHVPTNRTIDFNLLLGEAMFGIGWGLGLLCPGPALFHMGVGNPMVVFRWLPAYIVGAILAQDYKAKQAEVVKAKKG